MTPQELKEMALKASKQEYEAIMKEMEIAAKDGSFSCIVQYISDGAIEQLEKEGFVVQKKVYYNRGPFRSAGSNYFEVSFAK